MKKILALILSIGLLLSCLPVSTVAADSATVVAESYTTTQGSYAYIYLRADNFVNIGVLDIELYYDSSVMSIHYTSNGSFLSSASVSTNTSTPGVIKISAMALNGLNSTTSTYSNRMMTIAFKINSDCPVGEYPIAVTVGDAYDGDFNPANITGTNGVIKVEKASLKNFPFYNSLSATTLEEADEFTIQPYHSSSYKFASADFTIEYDRELLRLKSLELDPKLLVEGAVYSINTDNPGFAKISYASTNAISCYNLFKVTFEVIGNTDTQTDIKITASDVYDDELTSYSPATATATVSLKEKAVVPDYPDFKLESEKFIVGKSSDISVILEGNSKVAAADFVINYDKDVFSINSVTANSEALSSGALIVINNNFNDGQIRFSYIMQNGDFAEDTNLITISATPLISPDEHYTMTSSGIDVCDINFNDITLDYIDDSDCIFLPTVIDPTCTEDGYTSYDCSCGEAYTAEPTPSLGGHDYGDFVIDIEPTCTEEGSKSRHCSVCDDKTDITAIEATGHSYGDWIIDTDPTCTEEGSKYKECSVCGDVVSEVIAENGHSYSTEWTIDIEPTCTEEGSKSRHCSVCDDKTDITVIEANGHSYGDWIFTKAPGCIESGSAYKTCSTCGDIQEALSDLLLDSATYPESQHNYSDNINVTYNFSYPDAVALKLTFSSSTETESNYDFIYIYDAKGILQGKYSGTELSGETITLEGNSFSIKFTSDGSATRYGFSFDSIAAVIEDDVIKPLGHKYSDEWTIDIEPTCTEEGSKSHHCTVCDDKTDITVIEANGHSYGDWIIDTDPTCTEEGSKYKECSVCGDVVSEAIAENGHSYSTEWTIDIEPTCTEEGSKSHHCTVCGDKTDITAIEANGHSYGDWIIDTDPTCTEEGSKYKECSVCGDVVSEAIAENGHSYSTEWTIDIEPTCTEEGSKSHHCTVCGDKTDITAIEANGHSYGDWIVTDEPTCTEPGSKYKECSVCGDVVSEAIAENGHSYSTEWTIDIEPTCTEEGSKSHHCTVCGDKTDITAIDATGHSYGNWIIDTDPTCTEEGSKYKECSVCGDVVTDAIDSNGHKYSTEWTIDEEPTCTEEGSKSHHCSVCGDKTDITVIEATGHSYGDWIIDTDPTCTEEGSKYKECSVCGDVVTQAIGSYGHSYTEEWIIDIEPTCIEEGSQHNQCSICGDIVSESIPISDHSYDETDYIPEHPHTTTYTCCWCGDEFVEDSVDSSCFECYPIIGLDSTYIDHDYSLIYTTVQECSDITEIIGVSETAKAIPIASHLFGDYEFFGTGTIISVYDNDVHIGDYTLIVSGDVNGDSVCDVLDCAQVALVKNGHKTLDDVYALAADVNMDEVIDIYDYQEIVNIALAS